MWINIISSWTDKGVQRIYIFFIIGDVCTQTFEVLGQRRRKVVVVPWRVPCGQMNQDTPQSPDVRFATGDKTNLKSMNIRTYKSKHQQTDRQYRPWWASGAMYIREPCLRYSCTTSCSGGGRGGMLLTMLLLTRRGLVYLVSVQVIFQNRSPSIHLLCSNYVL
jgi:hypothetical protein